MNYDTIKLLNLEDIDIDLIRIKTMRKFDKGHSNLDVNLLQHWRNEIINSFIIVNKQRLSNGKMEGCNSRLKCIIKNANGYRNFTRFRNKCFFAINKDTPITDVSKKIKKALNKKDPNKK